MSKSRMYLIFWGLVVIVLIGLGIAAYAWRNEKLAYKPVELVSDEQTAWDELAIEDYTVTVEYKSLPFDLIEYMLTVEKGEIIAAECVDVRREEPCEERYLLPEDYTIDALFETAADLAKKHGGDVHFAIAFDPTYHYPQKFSIYTEGVEDGGRAWTVLSFKEME